MADTLYPNLAIIVAIARNGIIGATNDAGVGTLPWHLPEDLKHFKKTTNGHPIIMGRKTWESLGRSLPNRRNIVISRQADYPATGAEVFTSLPEAISAVGGASAFIIGGAELYRQALPLAGQLIITEVDLDVEGDTHFPPFGSEWRESLRNAHVSASGISYALVRYARSVGAA